LTGKGPEGKDVASRMAEIGAQLEAAKLQLREAEQARDAAKKQLAEARGTGGNSTLQSLLARVIGFCLHA
jgi:F0F1-type ATP synthase membrane subunit b/b'